MNMDANERETIQNELNMWVVSHGEMRKRAEKAEAELTRIRKKIGFEELLSVLFLKTFGLSADADKERFKEEWNKCVFLTDVICDYLREEEEGGLP